MSRDPFRLSKALFFELGLLASLFALSFSLGRVEELRRLVRAPALLAAGPFVAVATLLSLLSPHREHVFRALPALWIGGLALWLWSASFSRRELSRLLGWLLVPAALLAGIGVLQFHDIYQPFQFEALREGTRLAITSLAGNAGDLGAFLVLPALVAQRRLARREGGAGTWIALGLSLYGLAVTQTFAAAAALGAGVVLFWGTLLPRRRQILAFGTAVGAVLLVLAISAPFRARAVDKTRELARGDWNELLTGRLDGWRTGLYLLGQEPLTGVGFGAFRSEFLNGKEALVDRGVKFFDEQFNVIFANAHNEPIEVGAELGIPGLAALAWFLVSTVRRVRERPRVGTDADAARKAAIDRGFAWAALAALTVLSLVHFPFRIAIVASGALLFFAWLYADEEAES